MQSRRVAWILLVLFAVIGGLPRGIDVAGSIDANLRAIRVARKLARCESWLWPPTSCGEHAGALTLSAASGAKAPTTRSLFISGMEAWAAGDYELAESRWRQLARIDPANDMGRFWLGVAEIARGRWEDAAELLRSAHAGGYIVALAIRGYETSGLEGARCWLSAAARTGEAFLALEDAAARYFVVGRRADSVAMLRLFAGALQPETLDYWRAMGLLERLSGHPDLAVSYFTRALQASPNNLELLAELRVVLIDMGNYQQAMEIALREAELSSSPAQAYWTVAWVYRLQGDYENAKQWAQRTQQAAPGWWAGYNELAVATCALGDSGTALEHFGRALQLAPDEIGVRAARAECLYRTGDRVEAIRSAETLIQKYGDNPQLIDVYLCLGQWYTAAGDIALAEELYERGLQLWPQAYWLQARLNELPGR